jgi:hypothetical protein
LRCSSVSVIGIVTKYSFIDGGLRGPVSSRTMDRAVGHCALLGLTPFSCRHAGGSRTIVPLLDELALSRLA